MTRSPFITNGMGNVGPGPNDRVGFLPKDREVVATRSVKLKTKAAAQKEHDTKERAEYMAQFDANANKTIEHYNEQTNKAVDVISRYVSLVKDRTLSRNRNVIAADVEREIREQMINLALDLNNDENEPDNGKGSIVVLTVLAKIILLYRDRLNDLEFEVQQLRRELNKLSSPAAQQSSNAAK